MRATRSRRRTLHRDVQGHRQESQRSGLHVFKVCDGKVTSFQQFVDTAQMQDVMGAR